MFFGGAGSFVDNGYVVYSRTLRADHPKNQYAIANGLREFDNFFSQEQRSEPKRMFAKFKDYLNQIADNEARKEKSYLNNKITKMNFGEKYVNAINEALNNEDYGTAFTLINKNEQEILSIKKQLIENPTKWKGFQHTEGAFKIQSSIQNFIGQQIGNLIQIFIDDKGNASVQLDFSKPDLNIDQIIDNYFQSLDITNKITLESLTAYKEQITNNLLKYMKDSGAFPENFNTQSGIREALNDTASLKNFLKKNHKSLRLFINKKQKILVNIPALIANNIGEMIAAGIAQEINSLRDDSFLSLSTGKMQRVSRTSQQKVQIKGDVIHFDIFNGSIDIDEISQQINDLMQEQTLESLNSISDLIEQNAPAGSEIFEIVENIKGYKSKFNLKIEESGHWATKMKVLKDLKNNVGRRDFNKFIFFLNNTVEGAIGDSYIDDIKNLLATVCVAYMWDDYTDILNLDINSKSRIQTIHLFNSGGLYFSASQIIRQTIKDLEDYDSEVEMSPSSFVEVDIKNNFGLENAKNYYNNLVEEFPTPTNDPDNYELWQETLKKRWDKMRDEAIKNGKLGISFRQSGLERINNHLEKIVSMYE